MWNIIIIYNYHLGAVLFPSCLPKFLGLSSLRPDLCKNVWLDIDKGKHQRLRYTQAMRYTNFPDGYIDQCMLSSQLGSGISVVNLRFPTSRHHAIRQKQQAAGKTFTTLECKERWVSFLLAFDNLLSLGFWKFSTFWKQRTSNKCMCVCVFINVESLASRLPAISLRKWYIFVRIK